MSSPSTIGTLHNLHIEPDAEVSAQLTTLRKDYALSTLTEEDAGEQPLALFTRWMAQALQAQLPEPSAMTLATVGSNGQPSTRVVLLKSYDDAGLVWYSNYLSRKGSELANNPLAALQFHWIELERVVRVEGSVVWLDAAQSDAYYASRPLGSRIGAWASPQSTVVANKTTLMQAVERYSKEFGDTPPRPPHWGGFILRPERWEFWQGQRSRLHDRLVYERNLSQAQSHTWLRSRLAP